MQISKKQLAANPDHAKKPPEPQNVGALLIMPAMTAERDQLRLGKNVNLKKTQNAKRTHSFSG
jgi:hypothetical protein